MLGWERVHRTKKPGCSFPGPEWIPKACGLLAGCSLWTLEDVAILSFKLKLKLPGVVGHSWLVLGQLSVQGLLRRSNNLRLKGGKDSTRMFQRLRLSGYFMLPSFCEPLGVYVLLSLIMKNECPH